MLNSSSTYGLVVAGIVFTCPSAKQKLTTPVPVQVVLFHLG
jgi:hypothetical protein